jgi:nucleotide-binding universal stress UspA family protein
LIQIKAAPARSSRQWCCGLLAANTVNTAITAISAKETSMPHSILLPIDGNPRATQPIERCMRLARANAASVVAMYLLPCDDLATPEDDSYLPESERPASIVHSSNALREVEAAAAAAGVPCIVLTRCAAAPGAAMIAAAREQNCDMIFLDAMEHAPDAACLSALRQCGIPLAAPV